MRNLADRYENDTTTYIDDTLMQYLHENYKTPNKWLPEQSRWADSILTGSWYVSHIVIDSIRVNIIDEKYN